MQIRHVDTPQSSQAHAGVDIGTDRHFLQLYSAEVLHSTGGTAMRKGALSVLRARWSFIMTITEETIIEISFLLGGTPNFQIKRSEALGTGLPSILIALVAARDSRAASPIRVLIRRCEYLRV